jgi:hypothetical protein
LFSAVDKHFYLSFLINMSFFKKAKKAKL